MRTHQQIIKAHGASTLHKDLVARGLCISPTTPQRWADRNSIPSEYWADIVALKVASTEELMASAITTRRVQPPRRQAKNAAA